LIIPRLNGIVEFHQVNQAQSNVPNLGATAAPINTNTRTTGNALRQYAIHIEQVPNIPDPANPGQMKADPRCEDILADAQALKKSAEAILFCVDEIDSARLANGFNSQDLESAMAVILAHELV
jgi:hypothetical protein